MNSNSLLASLSGLVRRPFGGAGSADQTSVLFVCMGNICRSPMAHSMALHRAVPGLRVDSAGTHAADRGEPIDPRAAELLRRRGIAVRRRGRSRPVVDADFEQFDLLIAMDRMNLADLLERCPQAHACKLRLLLDFAPGLEGQDVPDPYFSGPDGFERVFDLCQAGIDGLLSGTRSNGLLSRAGASP